MSRREQELGYPSSHTRSPGPGPGPVGFSLPPIADVGIVGRPEVAASSLPKLGDGRELVSPDPHSSSKKRQSDDGHTTDTNPRSRPSSIITVEPPSKFPTPSPQLFSTWLPDDSLPFIQPQLLSEAEKETLERRLSEIRSSPPLPLPLPHAQAQVVRPKAPSSSSSPCTDAPVGGLYESPHSHDHQLSDMDYGRRSDARCLQAPYRRPPPLQRARTTDLELLRQVKSNNLTLPSQATMPEENGNRVEVPIDQGRTSRPLPLSRTPLLYPSSTSTSAQPPRQDGTTPIQPYPHHYPHSYHQQPSHHTRLVHPPSISKEEKHKKKRPSQSTLKSSSPRSMSRSEPPKKGGMAHSWPRIAPRPAPFQDGRTA